MQPKSGLQKSSPTKEFPPSKNRTVTSVLGSPTPNDLNNREPFYIKALCSSWKFPGTRNRCWPFATWPHEINHGKAQPPAGDADSKFVKRWLPIPAPNTIIQDGARVVPGARSISQTIQRILILITQRCCMIVNVLRYDFFLINICVFLYETLSKRAAFYTIFDALERLCNDECCLKRTV